MLYKNKRNNYKKTYDLNSLLSSSKIKDWNGFCNIQCRDKFFLKQVMKDFVRQWQTL